MQINERNIHRVFKIIVVSFAYKMESRLSLSQLPDH